jgi:hypothetical protein
MGKRNKERARERKEGPKEIHPPRNIVDPEKTTQENFASSAEHNKAVP